MQRNIRVLIFEPEKLPYEKVIPNRLKDKQEIVGGNIEYTRIDNDYNAVLICNEEGKLDGLPYNRYIGHDIIAGTFIVVADDPDMGEDRSLSDEQIEQYKKRFNEESIEETKVALLKIMLKNKDMEI